MSSKISSYQELIVWQKGRVLVKEIYSKTESFPDKEKFGLTNQLRRAAISIPSNIAEGYRRSTKPDYRHFLITAYGSTAEIETQLILSNDLHFINKNEFDSLMSLTIEISKMLQSIIKKLS